MPHTTITLNGQTLLDDPLDHWQEHPPEALGNMLKPGTKRVPWMEAAMVTLKNYILTTPIRIDITTNNHGGWTLTATPHHWT
jgi:hypothetical protein